MIYSLSYLAWPWLSFGLFLAAIGLMIAWHRSSIINTLRHKKVLLPVAALLLSAVIFSVSISNGAMNSLFFPTTYGPDASPAPSLSNLWTFFQKASSMEKPEDIAQNPSAVPVALTRTSPTAVKVELEAKEVIGTLANGVEYNYWTFNGSVPGPMIRAREGDTVEITLKNHSSSVYGHNIDLHAASGPGGGATVTNVNPGETKTFTFTALKPGLYVYHCAHQNAGAHMAHGMYGMMLVEPTDGLPEVDQEFYVMQGELYTSGSVGQKGLQLFNARKMLDGKPDYVVFNGRVNGATDTMKAKVGEKIRIYFGNAGVNLTSSFHVIGEIFDDVYPEGATGNDTATHQNVQTTVVPAGGATMVEFTADVPGKYVLVDHALSRLDRGAWGTIEVTGGENSDIFKGESGEHEHSGH